MFGKGNAKGKGKAQASADMEKLSTIDPSQKVWIGNLSGVTWKDLQQHFNSIGKTIYAAVFEKSQTGCVAYRSAAEVQQAVETMGGSWLGDSAIQVDYFTKPDGRTGPTGGKGKSKGKGKSWGKSYWEPVAPVWKPMFQKTSTYTAPPAYGKGKGKFEVKGKGKGKGKWDSQADEMAKLKGIDNSLKVWVGGLDSSVTWKTLQDHFSQVAKPAWATVFPRGTGCVAFNSSQEVESAILGLNGSTIGHCTLVVDVFEKKQH